MITYKGENYDIPDKRVISILRRYKFKPKIVRAFAQRTGLTLPAEFIAMCEEANSWAAEFISSDYDEPTEEWLLRLEMYFESKLHHYYRYGKLKEHPVAPFLRDEEGVCRMGEDYVYFITVYERGDAYTAFAYATTDKDDAARFVEKEQKKWTEGWATHALLWRSKLKLWGGEKILWGIYSVEKGEWLTYYSVDGNETVFFEDQVLVKAPYSSPNFGIFVCPMTVKDGRMSFTVHL